MILSHPFQSQLVLEALPILRLQRGLVKLLGAPILVIFQGFTLQETKKNPTLGKRSTSFNHAWEGIC